MSSEIKSIAFSPSSNDIFPSQTHPKSRSSSFQSDAANAGHKVIIADDDPVSREIVGGLLKKWGFQVIVANDGREAMEVLRAQTEPVLAVLDWMMPGLEGPDICRRVREVNRSVYILLLTARADKERIVEGLRAGADDYITKPFHNEELHARLNVGARIMDLQRKLSARVSELEAVVAENRALKLQIPI